MSIRRIVYYPDEPLCSVAQPVETFDASIEQLAADMFETMHANDGVGLAGPQIGLSKRILVLHEPDGPRMCLVNPQLSDLQGEVMGEEGCLSLPELYGQVPRAVRVRVRAVDERGRPLDFVAEDFLARIIQHEVDHLDGIVFPDRMDLFSREAKLKEWQAIRERLLDETPAGQR